MKDYIKNNIDIVKELLKIDEFIMKEKIDIDSLMEDDFKNDIKFNNSFILYDGNPKTTLNIINSDIKNSLLYPSHSYLGINKFLVSYKDSVYITSDENDFNYQSISDAFDNVFVLNSKEMYEELKNYYPNLKYIEI